MPEPWRPARAVRFWAWFSIAALALFAWGGVAVLALDIDFPVPLLFLGVVVYFLGQAMLLRALAADPEIPETRRQKLQTSLWWFGPAAVVQILVTIYRPGRGLGYGKK